MIELPLSPLVLLLLLALSSGQPLALTAEQLSSEDAKSDPSGGGGGPVEVGGEWHSATEPVIDYAQWTASTLLFRVAEPAANATSTSLQTAYWASARACRSQSASARLLHRDLLLSPAVLHLMLATFRLSRRSIANWTAAAASSSSTRFIFFADDNPSDDVTSVWAAEWLPGWHEATFVQLSSSLVNRIHHSDSNGATSWYFPVHLCHLPQYRLLPRPHPAWSELNHPASLVSISASILSCILLCAMLWLFYRMTRRLKRLQAYLTATYQALDSSGGCSTLGATRRVRYNGSTSLVNCSSIEARLERERRSNYYY